MQEVWLDIRDWEGFYQVSNKGRVRSLDRVYEVTDKRWKTTYTVNFKGRVLKGACSGKTGYTQYVFSRGKEFPYVTVLGHRLVAEAFHPNPDNLPFVHHIDHDKRNNNAENLRWVTPKENSIEFQKQPKTKTERKERLQNYYANKFTDEQIRWMKKLRSEGYRYSDLGEIFKADRWYISKMLNALPDETKPTQNIYCRDRAIKLVCPSTTN